MTLQETCLYKKKILWIFTTIFRIRVNLVCSMKSRKTSFFYGPRFSFTYSITLYVSNKLTTIVNGLKVTLKEVTSYDPFRNLRNTLLVKSSISLILFSYSDQMLIYIHHLNQIIT